MVVADLSKSSLEAPEVLERAVGAKHWMEDHLFSHRMEMRIGCVKS
jgi:hypothetical protein